MAAPPSKPPAITAALDLVGPRLRRVWEDRGLTLTTTAERTGISKSTVSRLENGQRRPSLELLLSGRMRLVPTAGSDAEAHLNPHVDPHLD